LEELIGSHLYAWLVKQLDEEELLFWLKNFAKNLKNLAAGADS
jgi:hypothetical protein